MFDEYSSTTGGAFAEKVVAELRSARVPKVLDESVEICGAWSISESRVAVIYKRDDFHGVIGLDLDVDSAFPVGAEVARILGPNVGEPLGNFEDQMVPDDHGVYWWRGEPPAWSRD